MTDDQIDPAKKILAAAVVGAGPKDDIGLEKVHSSVEAFREALQDPSEMLAWAALRVLGVKPTEAQLGKTATAISALVPGQGFEWWLKGVALQGQLFALRRHADELQEAGDLAGAAEVLYGRIPALERKILNGFAHPVVAEELRSLSRDREEARALARVLWAALSAEGRLRYFESEDAWLPEWVLERARPKPNFEA